MRSVEIISAERTMHHSRQPSAKNVAETNVHTARHHTDRRRGAHLVQFSYYSQKPQLYIKRYEHIDAYIQEKYSTNDYIQFILTIHVFYMNIDKTDRPAPQTHADPNPRYYGILQSRKCASRNSLIGSCPTKVAPDFATRPEQLIVCDDRGPRMPAPQERTCNNLICTTF